ncbi:hypothetical protein AB834_03525 [PVC group bacterium (ex Bugula neritina AB1)]|nr:hypothetical protein AB834_03525 [PVC group bacterium (ex Bugula neritina AB1)]
MKKKIPLRFRGGSLTYHGFKNCIEYAEEAFYPDLKTSRDYTPRDYRGAAIRDFFHNLEKADKSHILDIGGFSLLQEFNAFKHELIDLSISPYVQVNLLELRFIILSIISKDSKFLTTCNLLHDTDVSHWGNDPFLDSGGFIIDYAPLPFRAMKYVVLTTINGVNIQDQVTTLHKTNLLDIRGGKRIGFEEIIKKVKATRDIFFEFYSIFFRSSVNDFLCNIFKDPSNKFIQNSRLYFNKTQPVVNLKGFCDGEVRDIFLSFEDSVPIDSSNVDSILSEHSFSILNVYCDFLVMKFYEELFNKVVRENKIFFYPASDQNSFMVSANHVNTFQSHVKASFMTVYQMNAEILDGVLASQDDPISSANSWFRRGITNAKRVVSFRRHIPLFYELGFIFSIKK